MNQMSWPPQVPPPPPSPVPPPMPVAFSGNRGEFFDLAKRGAALELVTLGFYRFWLLTDIRRHLWSNTLVDGDAAEYTGRGKELLIGFLVALAILVPIYLGYFLIGLEAENVTLEVTIDALGIHFYSLRTTRDALNRLFDRLPRGDRGPRDGEAAAVR